MSYYDGNLGGFRSLHLHYAIGWRKGFRRKAVRQGWVMNFGRLGPRLKSQEGQRISVGRWLTSFLRSQPKGQGTAPSHAKHQGAAIRNPSPRTVQLYETSQRFTT